MKLSWGELQILLVCASLLASAAILSQGLRGLPLIERTLSPSSLKMLGGVSTEKTISVTGFGSASGKADQVVITLGVETESVSVLKAVEDNAERMSAVIGALKEIGVEEDSIETASFQVGKTYDEWGNPMGYRVLNYVNVRTKQLDLVGRILDTAIYAGADGVESLRFMLSEERMKGLKREAYMEAVRDAYEKAKLIAGELGVKITGGPLYW